jgi:hypothetical protein
MDDSNAESPILPKLKSFARRKRIGVKDPSGYFN